MNLANKILNEIQDLKQLVESLQAEIKTLKSDDFKLEMQLNQTTKSARKRQIGDYNTFFNQNLNIFDKFVQLRNDGLSYAEMSERPDFPINNESTISNFMIWAAKQGYVVKTGIGNFAITEKLKMRLNATIYDN